MTNERRVQVKLVVDVRPSDSNNRMSISEIKDGLLALNNVTDVEETGQYVGYGCVEISAIITGAKVVRRRACADIGSFFDRESYQLRSQTYDLMEMHSE